MKKLLSILTIIGMSTMGALSAVSCGAKQETKEDTSEKDLSDFLNDNLEVGSVSEVDENEDNYLKIVEKYISDNGGEVKELTLSSAEPDNDNGMIILKVKGTIIISGTTYSGTSGYIDIKISNDDGGNDDNGGNDNNEIVYDLGIFKEVDFKGNEASMIISKFKELNSQTNIDFDSITVDSESITTTFAYISYKTIDLEQSETRKVTFTIVNNLSDIITTTNLGEINDDEDSTIETKIKELNSKCNFSITLSEKTTNESTEKGSVKVSAADFEDTVKVTYTVKKQLSNFITTTDLGELNNKNSSTIINAVKALNPDAADISDLRIAGAISSTSATITTASSCSGQVVVTFTIEEDDSLEQLAPLIPNTFIEDKIDDPDDTDALLEKIKEINPNCPDDIDVDSNDSLSIVVSSPSYNGSVSISYEISRTAAPGTSMNATSSVTTWSAANPTRTETVKNKTQVLNDTIFSPYLDGGLVNGNDVDDIEFSTRDENGNGGLQNVTLAFIECVSTDNMKMRVAGATTDDSETAAATKVFKPLIESGSTMENVTIAFGGASARPANTPWTVASGLADGDFDKTYEIFKQGLLDYASYIATQSGSKIVSNKFDFDIEGALLQDTEGNTLLAKLLARMQKDLPNYRFSYTLPVLTDGLQVNGGKEIMEEYIQAFKDAGCTYDQIPVTNIMAMDYGEGLYDVNKSNFDYAKESAISTKNQVMNALKTSYGYKDEENKVEFYDSDVYPYIGVTPMIGINDVQCYVYTVEDAKDLYNWAHENNLASIGMWSLNDDNCQSPEGNQAKGTNNTGLTYTRQYDFVRSFSGNWDEHTINPYTSPEGGEKPSDDELIDIAEVINTRYLASLRDYKADTIINAINSMNGTNFTKDDLNTGQITAYGGFVVGRGKYKGQVSISFKLMFDISQITTEDDIDEYGWPVYEVNSEDYSMSNLDNITSYNDVFKIIKIRWSRLQADNLPDLPDGTNVTFEEIFDIDFNADENYCTISCVADKPNNTLPSWKVDSYSFTGKLKVTWE